MLEDHSRLALCSVSERSVSRLSELKPFGFQARGSAWLRDGRRRILGDEPGLGKSVQALRGAEGRTLILCPAMIYETWLEEIEKWRPALDATIVPYSKVCDRGMDVNGRLSEVLPHPRIEWDQPWDTIIADEAHSLKGRDTRWTLASERLTKRVERLFLLTGTPVPNWSHEIYMLLRIMHPGDRRFTNYWKWIERWFRVWEQPFGGTKVMGLKKGITWEAFVVGNGLDEMMLRRTRDHPEVVADMGKRLPVSHTTIQVPMVPAQAKLYRELKRDYLAWVSGSGQEVSAWSDGELHSKLCRIATGIEVLGDGGSGSGKINATREILRERRGNQTVLFCHYRNTADALVKAAKQVGVEAFKVNQDVKQVERDRIRKAFQAGQIECIVGSLGVITEGWTLTRADTCIFVEHSWRPSKNEGAIRRLDRIGQQRPVTVIHLVTAGTVDERQQTVIGNKTDDQVRMLKAHEFASML